MAAIQNRSRIVVSVKNRLDLTRAFPFDSIRAVEAYVEKLRLDGFKPRAMQESDTWEVRIRRKGSPSQNVTFRSYKQAETVHPFEDGNGRVGRVLVDLVLARDSGEASRRQLRCRLASPCGSSSNQALVPHGAADGTHPGSFT